MIGLSLVVKYTCTSEVIYIVASCSTVTSNSTNYDSYRDKLW